MTHTVYRERLAERDLLEHIAYLSQERPDVAVRFIDAVEQACMQLATMPRMGAPRAFSNPRLKGVRLWPVPGFDKYLIFYQFMNDEIRILRILHGARDIPAILESD